MTSSRTHRIASAAVASAAIAGAFAPGAAGDAVYHTQHLAIEAVGDAPLRSGFVNNIKANGPRVYAHEIYVLNGASPRTTYTVTNHFVVGDPDCDTTEGHGFDASFVTAEFTTNRSGNGRADIVIRPADVGGLTGTHSTSWTIESAAGDVYRTGCTTVELD